MSLKAGILLYCRRDGGSALYAFEAALGNVRRFQEAVRAGGRAGAGGDGGQYKTAVCVDLGLPRKELAIGMLWDAKEGCIAVNTCSRARRSYAGGIGEGGQLQDRSAGAPGAALCQAALGTIRRHPSRSERCTPWSAERIPYKSTAYQPRPGAAPLSSRSASVGSPWMRYCGDAIGRRAGNQISHRGA